MSTIKLPSGASVTLKDPSTLRVKDRNKVMLAGDQATSDFAKGIAFNEALLAIIIEEWDLDLLIPSVKVDSLGELSPADYDKLVEVAGDYTKALFPSLSKSETSEADPKASTDN
jgi:hypothetical protein